MRKIPGILAALSSLALVGLFATPVSADVQTGYSGDEQQVLISDARLIGGRVVTLEVTTRPDTVCNSWSVDLQIEGGDDATGGGESAFSVELQTPEVAEETPVTVVVTCNYTPASAAPAATGVASVTPASYSSMPVVSRSCGVGCVTNSNVVTLLPVGTDANTDRNGVLPGTGGAPAWLLVVGGVLIVGGAAVAVAARRRSS